MFPTVVPLPLQAALRARTQDDPKPVLSPCGSYLDHRNLSGLHSLTNSGMLVNLNITSRVTNHPSLPETAPVLLWEVLQIRKLQSYVN